MNSKGLSTAAHTLYVHVLSQNLLTVILLFIALLYPPIASAKLDDLPSDCKNFDHRNLIPYWVTNTNKEAVGYKNHNPFRQDGERRNQGEAIYQQIKNRWEQFVYDSSVIKQPEFIYSVHLVGEGHRIDIGDGWLEADNRYVVTSKDHLEKFETVLLTRFYQEKNGDGSDARTTRLNDYSAVEPYIREALKREWNEPVQDLVAAQEEHQPEHPKELNQENQTDKQNQQAAGATLDTALFSSTDNAETPPTSTELRQDNSIKSSSTGAEHLIQNLPAGSGQADQIYQLPTQEVRSEPINTWNAPAIGRVFQTLAISLLAMFAGVVFILWKIIRQA